jgi:hypothetical protein
MEQKNYQIIIKIPFQAMDDVAARQITKTTKTMILNELFSTVDSPKQLQLQESETKLQEIYKDKAPRGIII